MLRRLRGKRSGRGYSDVDGEGCAQQDVIHVNAAHKQRSNRSPYTASPPNHPTKSTPVQKKVISPSSSPRQEHYRAQRDHLGRRHQSQQQRKGTKTAFDSPDDVSRGFTTLTYESSLTETSNHNNPLDDYILPSPFSTIWEKVESNFEPASNKNNAESTAIKVAEARRSALHIATNARGRHDGKINIMQRNTYKSNQDKQRSTTRTESKIIGVRHTTSQQPPTNAPESRRHDHEYRPTPPQQRKSTHALNSSKGNDTIIKVRLPSQEMHKKDTSPPPSLIASSAQTPKLNNGTNHLITRLLKKHQCEAERTKDKKATMEPLEQTDLVAPTAAHDHLSEAARKFAGQKPDPESRASAVAAPLDRSPDPPPDPPAEEWKRPIPVNRVLSTHTKNTASSSKFWDEVEDFPVSKEDYELQQFFTEHLVKVKREPVDLKTQRNQESKTQAAAPRRTSDPPQNETDNVSNAFSLNLAVDKDGRFDDSDISALEMFDSATVYYQTTMETERGNVNAQNYWKLKYDRLKEETRAAMKRNKIVEESTEFVIKQGDLSHEPKSLNELNRLFSGLTGDLGEGAAYPQFCRDGLSQTMNLLMHKMNKLESIGEMQIDRHIEDNACVAVAEQVIFPVDTLQYQREENPRQEQNNLTNAKSLADDLTAGAASRVDGKESHMIEFDAADLNHSSSRSARNARNEREMTSVPGRVQGRNGSRPNDNKDCIRQELNVITPDKLAGSPDDRQPRSVSAAKDEVTHPIICLGSLHIEATTTERVRQSLLRCSDSLLSRFPCNSSSNQLAIPNGIDHQKLILLCQKPQFLGKTISQTVVHYGKKVMQKREVISELNQNILRFGARHPLVGESHLKVGLLHMYDGHYADAILHLEEALKIKATSLGSNDPDFSSILMFIALAQLALERFDDCIAALLGVRRIREDALGKNHPEIGLILNNIGCVHYELGDFNMAEASFQEALDLQREAFTTDPTFLKSVSTLLGNIAFLHAKNGLFPKALIELEGALQIQQEILCDDKNEEDAIMENIAHIMAIQKMQHGSGNMEEITNQYMTMLKRR
jgi:tetratricopeptide (TPR) repeat protein